MDDTVYKIAIAAFLHDIGKFAERGNKRVFLAMPGQQFRSGHGLRIGGQRSGKDTEGRE